MKMDALRAIRSKERKGTTKFVLDCSQRLAQFQVQAQTAFIRSMADNCDVVCCSLEMPSMSCIRTYLTMPSVSEPDLESNSLVYSIPSVKLAGGQRVSGIVNSIDSWPPSIPCTTNYRLSTMIV
jgi:hypothetical protein